MQSLKKVWLLLTCLTVIFMTTVSAADVAYKLDKKNSIISFSTIKKQYIVEKASFFKLEGEVAQSGKTQIRVDTSSIDTGDIRRDDKLKFNLFSKLIFSKLTVTANIPMSALNVIRNYRQRRVPITIEYAGAKNEAEADFIVAKTQDRHLIVASMTPIIIDISDYGVPLFILSELSKAIGKGRISSEMAFNFVLVFKKQKQNQD